LQLHTLQFTHLDEHSLENANDRDEKRWMEKKNATQRKKLKKEEMVRVRKLVDNAHACDPRIQAAKQAVKDAKKAKVQAKVRTALCNAMPFRVAPDRVHKFNSHCAM
jgi:DnaJ family protein C protein 2